MRASESEMVRAQRAGQWRANNTPPRTPAGQVDPQTHEGARINDATGALQLDARRINQPDTGALFWRRRPSLDALFARLFRARPLGGWSRGWSLRVLVVWIRHDSAFLP
jgi:hypothetical protein